MKFLSGKCIFGFLMLACLTMLIGLNMRIAYTGENAESSPPKSFERLIREKTSETLSELIVSIQNLKDNVLPPDEAASLKPVPISKPVTKVIAKITEKNVEETNTSNFPYQNPAKPPQASPAERENKKVHVRTRVMASMKPVQISDNYQATFQKHISRNFPKDIRLDKYMKRLSASKQCRGKPLFVTMARVKSDLYWQLIENFFFTMYRYGHTDCAVMICISGTT